MQTQLFTRCCLESSGLLFCFYQLFGLSFWRHPFHLLGSKWCNATFLQICFNEEMYLHHWWCEDEYIFSKFSFLGEPFNNCAVIALEQHISSRLAWSYKQRLIDSSKCLGPLARGHLVHRRGWTALAVTQHNIFPVFSAWAGKTLAGKTQTLALAPNPPPVSLLPSSSHLLSASPAQLQSQRWS